MHIPWLSSIVLIGKAWGSLFVCTETAGKPSYWLPKERIYKDERISMVCWEGKSYRGNFQFFSCREFFSSCFSLIHRSLSLIRNSCDSWIMNKPPKIHTRGRLGGFVPGGKRDWSGKAARRNVITFSLHCFQNNFPFICATFVFTFFPRNEIFEDNLNNRRRAYPSPGQERPISGPLNINNVWMRMNSLIFITGITLTLGKGSTYRNR